MKESRLIREGLQSKIEVLPKESGDVVRKSATEAGKNEVIEQVDLLLSLPDEMKPYYPEIVEYQVDKAPYYYDMVFIDLPTMRDVMLYGDQNVQVTIEQMSHLMDFLQGVQHRWSNVAVPEGYVKRKYLDRAIKRLYGMADKDYRFKRIVDNASLSVDGEVFPNAIHTIDSIGSNGLLIAHLTPDRLVSTHGQLEFAHIFVNANEPTNFKLIDHRGINDRLDPGYDYGKLLVSSSGAHDWIEEGFVTIDHISDDLSEISVVNFDKMDRLPLREGVNAAIEGKLVQMGERTLLTSKFAEAMHLLGSVPYCYGAGHLDRAIACYVAGLRSLTQFQNML